MMVCPWMYRKTLSKGLECNIMHTVVLGQNRNLAKVCRYRDIMGVIKGVRCIM